MLDQVFHEDLFVNEIIWKRQSAHNDAKQGSRHLGRVHDTILLYAKGEKYHFEHQYKPYDENYVVRNSTNMSRKELVGDILLVILVRLSARLQREILFTSFWGWSVIGDSAKIAWKSCTNKEGSCKRSRSAVPRQKRYLDEGKGVPIGTVWDDIGLVQGQASEGLGYPTQKPLKLLERILGISTKANDVVLDAFCGCGTAICAAENMGRQWIGIDVSPTACRVMEKRMRTVCHLQLDERLWKAGRGFVVRDLPWSEDKLKKIPPSNLRIGL